MNIIKKITGILCACVMLQTVPFVSMADGTVITRIVLEVEANIQVGQPCSARDFEFTVPDSGYEVSDAVLVNTGTVWGSADVPRLLVYLRADDGAAFDVDRSDILVRGAECEYGRWDGNQFAYIMQLRLPSLREQVGGIEEAAWSSSTAADWSDSYNVAYYELQLYQDGKKICDVQSGVSHYDFGGYMRNAGNYTYRVRAVNQKNENTRSDWKQSTPSAVSAALAEQLREQYAVPWGGYGQGGPLSQGAVPYYQDRYGWIDEGSRWWYRNPDGSYTTDNWQYIDEKWYYFDSKGYMVTGWIDWNGKSYYCDPESGAMLVNTIVPDGMGRRVDSSGAMIE